MNFDIPPATRSSTSSSRSARHSLHQRIREFNTIRAQRESIASNDGYHSPRRASFQDQTPAPPPALMRGPRVSHRRHRVRPTSDSPTSRLMDQLQDARAEADSLLEQPIPRIGSPDVATREYLGEAEVNRQRKRRKIDHEGRRPGVGMNGFRYGFRGTATPGPLKMQIAWCDGGLMHPDAGRIGREYYGPENVLRNNKSVYCTNSNVHKCNIIIRHMDEATFTLSKIVIKAPTTGFTAPIQEGLIFITMSQEGLLPRTAAYRVQESSPLLKNTVSREEDTHRPPSRRRDSTSRSIPPPISQVIPLPIDSYEHPFHGPSTSPPTTTTSVITTPPPLVPGFEITTHCESPSSDEEEPSSAETILDRQRRDLAPPPYVGHSSDSDDTEDDLGRELEARDLGISHQMLRRELRNRRRPTRLAEPSRIECRIPSLDPKIQTSSNPGREATRGSEDQQMQQEQQPQRQPQLHQDEKPSLQQPRAPLILPPHARFFIEPDKSVVSVKFEPEVTGKFILLKLWSPSRDQNIDIQSIIAYGFAGPRSFPGTTML